METRRQDSPITLTNNHYKHGADEQPAKPVELVNVVGPRARRRARPIRHGPSQTVDAGRFGQLGVEFVVVRGVREPAEGQVGLFGVQHCRDVVQHVRAVVPAVRLVQVALGRRDHRREVHVPSHDLQDPAADAGRGPTVVRVVSHHRVGRVFVADALQRAPAHVARLWLVREEVDTGPERAALPAVQQKRPAQLTATVRRERPVRVRVDDAVVLGHQSDHVDVFAVSPEIPEHPPDAVHGRASGPHGHKVALLRDVQQPHVLLVFGDERIRVFCDLLRVGRVR